MDIDAFNTSLIGRLASIVMPDTPVKGGGYLEAFSRWVDNGYSIRLPRGDRALLKTTVRFPPPPPLSAYAVDGFSGGAVNADVWLLSTRSSRWWCRKP